MNDNEKHVFEIIFTRRSVRRFVDGKQVEKQKITKLLEAAMAAPSACNLQPWEFVIVTEKDALDQLKNATLQGNYNAPLAMIVCANVTNIPWDGYGWMIDCSAAIENMLIAATAMGLGSVWIGASNEDIVHKLFNIPDHIHISAIIYFGYPVDVPPIGTRYADGAVYWDKYDPTRKREMRTIDMKYDLSVNPPTPWED